MAVTRPVSLSGGAGGADPPAGASSSSGSGPRTATMFACVATLSNTLLGVSVVGVAGGFSRAGYAVGTFFLALFACLSGSGLHLLARSSMTVSAAAKRSEDAREEAEGPGVGSGGACPPPSSFRAVALVGAPRWALLIDLAVALKCFGVATSYLVVIGDLMPTAMADILGESHADSFLLERRFWVTGGFLLAAPLAFSRTLGALRYTATLAISLVVFLAGMVVSYWILPGLDACPIDGKNAQVSFYDVDETGGEAALQGGAVAGEGDFSARGLSSTAAAAVGDPFSPDSSTLDFAQQEGLYGESGDCFEGSNAVGSIRTILQTLPIFVFCFTCHQNIFTICNEIVRPTPARIDAVIFCSMIVAGAVYLSISWGAYATFGVGVDGDLLKTYPRTGLLTTARICVSMLVTSCYPLQAHPSRTCILSTWKAFHTDMQKAYSGLASVDEEAGEHQHQGRRPPPSSSSSLPRDDSVAGGGSSSGGSGGGSVGGAGGVGSTATLHEKIRSGGGSGSNTNSSHSSSSSSREGSVGGRGSSDGERGRRRVVGGVRGDGAGVSIPGLGGVGSGGGGGKDTLLQSPERERRGEAEREELLSEMAGALSDSVVAPNGGAGAGVGSEGEGNGRLALHPRGGYAIDGETAVQGAEDGGFWTSREGFRHGVATAGFLGASYAIAMAVNDLGVLLAIVGATGSTTIAFILPGLLYLKVHPDPHPKRSLATLQLAVGLIIMPVALTFIALGDPAEGRR